ncbi:MAG: polysaccharide deacetylase family protein [Sulfurovum sp.]
MMSARKIYKYIFLKILDILKIDKKYLKLIKSSEYLVVLNLHRVSNDKNSFYPSLTPQLFEALLKYITKEFNVITFQEIEEYKNSKKPSIILSFDDGFYDFKESAMPILKKYNIKANLNIIPKCIENREPIWDVMLGDILNQLPIKIINQIELGEFNIKLNYKNRSKYGLALTRYLKQKTYIDREELWKNIKNSTEKYDIKFTQMLNKKEIIEISEIHEIGVHSYSHESMGIESKEYFEEDFFKCKEYFENILKLPLDIYAFPSGSYQEYQLDYLEENKIKYILLVGEEYSSYHSNRYSRFTYYADSISEIKIRVVGFHR